MNNEDLVAQIAALKATVKDFTEKFQNAKVREQIIDAKIAELTNELKKVAGDINWTELGATIDKAAADAQRAVQALQEALDAAGVAY